MRHELVLFYQPEVNPSSLAYLKRLRVAWLKIDQSFVNKMLAHTDDQAIVKGIISLAGVFGCSVIAEGVETIDHGTLAARPRLACGGRQKLSAKRRKSSARHGLVCVSAQTNFARPGTMAALQNTV